MKYVVNWIPLRIHVRSRNTQPHLNKEKPTIGKTYDWKNLRLARGSAESVCLRADRYLHHVGEPCWRSLGGDSLPRSAAATPTIGVRQR